MEAADTAPLVYDFKLRHSHRRIPRALEQSRQRRLPQLPRLHRLRVLLDQAEDPLASAPEPTLE